MWETIRGYLTFTRKERYGVLFLLMLIFIFFVLPYFFKHSPGDPDPASYNKIKEDVRKFESRFSDSSRESVSHGRYPDQKIVSTVAQAKAELNSQDGMFYFDPNKIGADDWLRLGLTDRVTQTIRHYIEKGGRFRKVDDLKKLYGLRNADYERLSPYVRINRTPIESTTAIGYKLKFADDTATARERQSLFHKENLSTDSFIRYAAKNYVVTDINFADSNAWSRLPGIGEKLASRIIRFREKLGGFYQIEQVAETFGLPDTTFQKIKPYLQIHSVSLRQIDINTATKEILLSHPYIQWQLARGITEYRLQHGAFHSINELLQLAQMDRVKFEKLKPYLIDIH
jgi:competence protein ComEA